MRPLLEAGADKRLGGERWGGEERVSMRVGVEIWEGGPFGDLHVRIALLIHEPFKEVSPLLSPFTSTSYFAQPLIQGPCWKEISWWNAASMQRKCLIWFGNQKILPCCQGPHRTDPAAVEAHSPAPRDTKINRWDTSIRGTVVKNHSLNQSQTTVSFPHTCLGVTTARMSPLKLHPVTPQGERDMSRRRSFPGLSELLLEQGSATFPQGCAKVLTHVLFYQTGACRFMHINNGNVRVMKSRAKKKNSG